MENNRDAHTVAMRLAQANCYRTRHITSMMERMHMHSPPVEYIKDELIYDIAKGIKNKVEFEEREDVLTNDVILTAEVYIFNREDLIRLLEEYRMELMKG